MDMAAACISHVSSAAAHSTQDSVPMPVRALRGDAGPHARGQVVACRAIPPLLCEVVLRRTLEGCASCMQLPAQQHYVDNIYCTLCGLCQGAVL